MGPFSNALTTYLLDRAKWKCEYCCTPINLDNSNYFEREHIVPVSKSGDSDVGNLAVACIKCNRKKSDKTIHYDYQSNEKIDLFNPRKDVWNDHFQYSHLTNVIIGKTKKGRATANLLQLNHTFIDAKSLFKDNEYLYTEKYEIVKELSLLRKLRLNCYFEKAQSYGNFLFNNDKILCSKNKIELQYWIAIQIIESFFTRSKNKQDIIKSIRQLYIFKKYFSKYKDVSELNRLFITFYNQLNTLYQFRLSKLIFNILRPKIDSLKWENDFYSKVDYISRCTNLNRKYISFNDVKFIKNNLTYLDDLQFQNPNQFIFNIIRLIDVIKLFPNLFLYKQSSFLIEKILHANNLIREHYAFDFALFSLIQKRMLSLDAGCDLSKYTLNKEALLKYANEHNLHNEKREIIIFTQK